MGPEGLIQAGLLILIATPVARVMFTLVAFVLERDRVYVGITLAVLSILVYSWRRCGCRRTFTSEVLHPKRRSR